MKPNSKFKFFKVRAVKPLKPINKKSSHSFKSKIAYKIKCDKRNKPFWKWWLSKKNIKFKNS